MVAFAFVDKTSAETPHLDFLFLIVPHPQTFASQRSNLFRIEEGERAEKTSIINPIHLTPSPTTRKEMSGLEIAALGLAGVSAAAGTISAGRSISKVSSAPWGYLAIRDNMVWVSCERAVLLTMVLHLEFGNARRADV